VAGGTKLPKVKTERYFKEILAHRERVYKAAKARNPQRWPGNIRNWKHVSIVYLNPARDSKVKMAA
jgi:putative transposase